MHKFLTLLARFFAIACALAFAISLVAALILTDAENKLFQSETYKQALQTTDLYQRLPALVSRQIVASLVVGPPSAAGPKAPDFLQYLSARDWEILILTIFPPQEMRQFSEQALDQVADYFNGKSNSVVISLVPFKQRLSQKSAEAAEQILAVQPRCDAQQLINISLAIVMGQRELGDALCNPPAELTSALLPVLGRGLQTELAAIPDSVPLFDTASQPDLRPRVERARLVMRLSLLVPLFFLVLMTLLAVRSRKSWLRWWGIPLSSAGALGLLIGLLNEPIARLILIIQAPHLPAYLADSFEAVLDVTLAVTREVANPLMLQSALILAAGLAMTALAKYTGTEKVGA